MRTTSGIFGRSRTSSGTAWISTVPSTRPEGYAGPVSARVQGVRVRTGTLDATGMRFGIVVSRFNDIVSMPLLEGAVEALEVHGASADDIVVAWVPGAFETPIAA